MKRIRAIKDAIAEIKAADPKTAVTEHFLRRIIVSGELQSIRSGNKYLIDMDRLEDYLSRECEATEEDSSSGFVQNKVRAVV